MFEKLKIFLHESRQELARVNWPSRAETARYTFFVIAFSLAVAVFLGILDFIFVQVLEKNLIF